MLSRGCSTQCEQPSMVPPGSTMTEFPCTASQPVPITPASVLALLIGKVAQFVPELLWPAGRPLLPELFRFEELQRFIVLIYVEQGMLDPMRAAEYGTAGLDYDGVSLHRLAACPDYSGLEHVFQQIMVKMAQGHLVLLAIKDESHA